MVTEPNATLDSPTKGEALPFHQIFEAQPGLLLVLSPQLVVQAATDAYLREVLKQREELVGRYLFDAFPDNPENPDHQSQKVKASLELALATKQPQKMELLQYDIEDPDNPGQFLERFWLTTNMPVVDSQGNVLCLIHETENVTEKEKAKRQLQESQIREKAATADAELQRLRMERFFDQAPAAVALLEGPDFVYKVLNKAYQQLFPGRALMGLPLFEALPELKNGTAEEIINKVYQTGETFEGKEVLIPVARYQGQAIEDIYWNFIYQALYDAQGQVNGILIFALDVTEFVEARRQVERSAQELQTLNTELEQRVEERTRELQLAKAASETQRLQLENLFMQAPTAIVILDGPELTYQLINPVYQQIFPGRELLGKPLLKALPELEGTPIPDLLKNVYQTGETYVAKDLMLKLARHEGGPLEEIHWTFTYQARYNAEGKIDGVMVFAYEVTDQVVARKTIEDGARQLRLITDSLPVLISYLDKEEKYKFTNKAYEAWFPHRAHDFIGKTALEVVGEKAYAGIRDYIRKALAGERQEFEATMPYREGFTRHIKTNYVPDIQKGEVCGFYVMITDVTEQVEARKKVENSAREAREMAEELVKINEELRLANRELGKVNKQLTHTNIDLDNFIYTASHDLKAPISNIEMLMQELLEEIPAQSRQQQGIESILHMMQGSIDRFKKTISSLTEITKLQKDHNQQEQQVNLSEIVEEVKLDLQRMIQQTKAKITSDIEENLLVSFSEKNLRSIVYNILSNAIKYRHPERARQIQISCRTNDKHFILSVQDNGLGLSTSQQEKLFTMFKRFHDHVEGSGVGLYMVKRIIDNVGGKIKVESTPGEGSKFSIYLKHSPLPQETIA
ncbi:MAG: PAS domain-containing protein [Rufibacter sp.]